MSSVHSHTINKSGRGDISCREVRHLRQALNEMALIKHDYLRDRFAFVDGRKMEWLIRALGAVDADLDAIQHLSGTLPADPTLAFRRSKNGRYCFDTARKKIERLEFCPFVLAASDDFVRHDSGQARSFAEIGEDLQSNSALHGLMRFKAFMVQDSRVAPRPNLDYRSTDWICTLFHLLTVTTPQLQGEPALEGVHSDGVDHTMTTMLNSDNMTPDSAATFLHEMQEQNGKRWHQAAANRIAARYRHRRFLDTLLIVDHEYKHSVSPVVSSNKDRQSTRDMLIFFTRKPAKAGHVSHPYDSLTRHESLSMSLDFADACLGASV